MVRQVTSFPRLGDPLAALLLRAPGAACAPLDHSCPPFVLTLLPPAALAHGALLVLLCPLVLPTSSKSMDGKRQGGLEPAWSIEKGKFLCQCWMLSLLPGGRVQTFWVSLSCKAAMLSVCPDVFSFLPQQLCLGRFCGISVSSLS